MKGLLRIYFLSLCTLFISSCDDMERSECFSRDISVDNATDMAIGRWKLVSMKSGWTGKITEPTHLIELLLDVNSEGKIFDNSKEIVRFKYILEKRSNIIVYNITDSDNSSEYLPDSRGNFEICHGQLTMGDTGLDGSLFLYTKN